jgi:hypothetical protein
MRSVDARLLMSAVVGPALLGVRQRVEGLVERERLVDARAELAGVVRSSISGPSFGAFSRR